MSETTPAANDTSETMSVTQYDILGNLVKSWSTGDASYTEGTLHPVPSTIEELRTLLQALGAGANIPPHITKLTIVRYGVDEMVLRVPPAALIRAKEARLKQDGTTYRIPAFYKDDPVVGSEPDASVDDKMLLQARRIGDYTIAHCE